MLPIATPYSAAAVAIVAAVTASIPRKKHRSTSAKRAMLIYTIAFSALMIASYWSTEIDYALNKILGFGLLVWVPVILITNIRVNANYLSMAFVVLGAFLLVGAISGGVFELMANPARLAAFGGGPNTFGRFMAIAAIAAYGTNLRGRAVLTSLFVLGAIGSQSRGALLGLAAAGVVYLSPAGLKRLREHAGIWVTIILVLLMAWRKLAESAKILMLTRFTSILKLTDLPGSSSFSTRMILVREALQAFATRPIAGLGFGGFSRVSAIDRYPHNLVLEALCETGVIGAAVILLPLFAAGIRCCTNWRRLEFHRQPYAYWYASSLVSVMFSGDIVDSRIAYMFAAFVLSCSSADQRSESV